ncbi:hypothetical protein EV2_030752 [Malus domestica]
MLQLPIFVFNFNGNIRFFDFLNTCNKLSPCIPESEKHILHMYDIPFLEQLTNAQNVALHTWYVVGVGDVLFSTILLDGSDLSFAFKWQL